jgi:hypothetical protein
MTQINTNVYRPRQGGLASLNNISQNLGSIPQMMQQSRMADLAMQRRQFEDEQMRAKIKREERERQRIEQERKLEEKRKAEFMAQYQTAQMEGEEQVNPEKIQEIYANVYPDKYAEMQVKSALKQSSNPMAMLEYERKMANQKMAQERLEMQKEEAKRRQKKDAYMENYRDKSLAWKQKNYDRSVYEFDTALAEKIRDQDWDESSKEREQLELHQKIAPVIQKFKMPDKKLDIIEVRKINEGTSATGNILALSGSLKSQIDKHGLEKIKGKNKAKMQSTVRSLATSLNNPMFVNSGVMSQGELENLKEMVGDPTDWMALSKDEDNARMEALQEFIKSKYINSLNAYGVYGDKAYNAIRLKTKGFFNKNADKGQMELTSEEESWTD